MRYLLIRGRQLEAFCLAEQVRRLRRGSQPRPGRLRVTVRANYVGLPSMAGRGTDEGGESRRIMGLGALSRPRKYGPEVKNRRQWSAGRRDGPIARPMPRLISVVLFEAPSRRSAPPWGEGKKDRRPQA